MSGKCGGGLHSSNTSRTTNCPPLLRGTFHRLFSVMKEDGELTWTCILKLLDKWSEVKRAVCPSETAEKKQRIAQKKKTNVNTSTSMWCVTRVNVLSYIQSPVSGVMSQIHSVLHCNSIELKGLSMLQRQLLLDCQSLDDHVTFQLPIILSLS